MSIKSAVTAALPFAPFMGVVLTAVGGVAFIGYKFGQFSKQERETDLKIYASNENAKKECLQNQLKFFFSEEYAKSLELGTKWRNEPANKIPGTAEIAPDAKKG